MDIGLAEVRRMARLRHLVKARHWLLTCHALRKLRLWRRARVIRRSGLLDQGYYLQQYPDVDAANLDPVLHYVTYGAAEGRNPHPIFDTSFYMQQNPDVAGAKVNPLFHFVLYGAREGRDPHPLFHTSVYLKKNPDVAKAGVNPLYHYVATYEAAGGREALCRQAESSQAFLRAKEDEVACLATERTDHRRVENKSWPGLSLLFWRWNDRAPSVGTRWRKYYDSTVRGANNLLAQGPCRVAVSALAEAKRRLVRNSPPIAYYRAARLRAIVVDSTTALPNVDVIIVTYNSERHITRCLTALGRGTYPREKVSIVVVDNCSKDRTVSVLDALAPSLPELQIVRSASNLGFGRGVNLGVSEGSAPYLLFLNPDTEIQPKALERLVHAAMDSEVDGARAWEARQRPYEHPKFYDPVTLDTEWVSGACCLVRRDAFQEVSGFDPNIFMYAEDIDLSWRLQARGYRLRYVPDAEVIHRTYESPNAIKPTQFYNSIISNGILRHKFGDAREVGVFYLLYLECLLRPPELDQVRLRLVWSGVTALPRFLRALLWRTRH